MEKRNTIVQLSSEIETLLEDLRGRITRLEIASSSGSVIANEALAEIGKKTGNLAALALQGRTNGLLAVEKMRQLLQEIVSVSTENQDEVIQLGNQQAIAIKRYIDGIGQKSSDNRITKDTSEQRKLRLDLGEKGIVIITVYISGPTILAWKLDRQKTKTESQNLKGWLDRILEKRSGEITLNTGETADFLRTFQVKDPDRRDDRHYIAVPRTFATIVLADGRKVSITFSVNRANDEYLAEWVNPKQGEDGNAPRQD